MKKNAGTEPTPSRVATRISSPRLVAIVSSSISLTIVVCYFSFFAKKGISEKEEINHLSNTPERAAENYIAALSENEIESALRLCKGSARKAVLDGTLFRHMKQAAEHVKESLRTETTNVRRSTRISIDSDNESQKPAKSISKVVTTRASTDNDRSTEKREPVLNGEFLRTKSSTRNTRFRKPEPLLFSVHESHREEKNRVLLIGTAKGKKSDRIYFPNIEVIVEKSNSRWFVTRFRIK